MASTAGPAAFPGGLPLAQPHYLVDQNGSPIGSGGSPLPILQIIGGAPVSATNPLFTLSEIEQLILNGQGFAATTGLLSGASGNLLVGMQLLCNAVAKNVLVYNALCNGNGATPNCQLLQGTTDTSDSNLSANATIVNQSGAAITSVATVTQSPATLVQTSGQVGTPRAAGSFIADSVVNLLQNESVVFIPKGTVGFVALYAKIITSGNTGAVTLEWVEF